MKPTVSVSSVVYNSSINETVLERQEAIDPHSYNLITYSKPKDTCQGRDVFLGNMTGGFPIKVLGHSFRSVEHLYLLGEWSHEDQTDIQKDILTATSGYAAKRYKKCKYRRSIREDYPTFRHQWMLWCIWQKCLGNKDFREHLLSFEDDEVIVEVVKGDPVWAAYPDEKGILRGGNAVGKILTICRRCLKQGTHPNIDTELLNRANIYILGEKVEFRDNSEALSA